MPNTTLRISGGTPYDGDYTIAAVTATVHHADRDVGRRSAERRCARASRSRARHARRGPRPRARRLGAVRRERRCGRSRTAGSRRSTGSSCCASATTSTTTPNSQILAGKTIDIYGDYTNGDAHFGTTMILRGTITANCISSGTGCDPFSASAGHAYVTQHLGPHRRRHVPASATRPASRAARPSTRPATSSSAGRRASTAARTVGDRRRPTARTASSSTTCRR